MTRDQFTTIMIYWVPMILLVGVWIFFIRKVRRGHKDVSEINATFLKQNEEIISLLRDIKRSLENRTS